MIKDSHIGADRRSVAPVISVILMVAVAVIIASVVAVFALGITEDVDDTGPQASFNFDYVDETGNVEVTHTGGEHLNGDQLRFTGAALTKNQFGGITEWKNRSIEAGTTATVNVKAGETLRVAWQSDDGVTTRILGEYDVSESIAAASGAIDTVTADATADQAYVDISSLSSTGGNGELVVENLATGATATTTVTTVGTKTISLGISDGDTVQATLYETSSQTNQLEQESDTAAAASISNVNGITATNTVEFDLDSFSDSGGNVFAVVENVDTGEVKTDTFFSTGTKTVQMNGVFPGNKVVVTVYETSSTRNELDSGTDP